MRITLGGCFLIIAIAMFPISSLPQSPVVIKLSDFEEDIRLSGNFAGTNLFGHDLAVADFNGDGFSDILVGAYGYNVREDFRFNIGRAFILFGTPAQSEIIDMRDTNVEICVITGDDPRDNTGDTVGAGDINGDGISDAIIGSLQLGHPIAKGKSYIVYGRPEWPSEITLDTNGGPIEGVTRIIGKQSGDAIGQISASGDINNDGYEDILIGAATAGKAGESYIVYGADSMPQLIDLATYLGNFTTIHGTGDWSIGQWGQCFDLNMDGFYDLLLGDPNGRSFGTNKEGIVVIIYGSAHLPKDIAIDELTLQVKHQLIYGASEDKLGYGFAAGDMNGNGLLDLAITSVGQNTYVMLDFPTSEPSIKINDYDPKLVVKLDGDYSKDLKIADFNADGLADLLIGSAYEKIGPWRSGAAFTIYGSRSLPSIVDLRPDTPLDNTLQILPYINYQTLGNSVASGDINSDGIDDIIVGAAYTPTIANDSSGEVYIIYGRSANTPVTVFEKAQLLQSFPNPFNANTIIRYQLERSQQIRMAIYNARGQKVRRLVDGVMPAGEHRAIWNGYDDSFNQAGSGVYFCRIGGETFNQSIKLLYLK